MYLYEYVYRPYNFGLCFWLPFNRFISIVSLLKYYVKQKLEWLNVYISSRRIIP